MNKFNVSLIDVALTAISEKRTSNAKGELNLSTQIAREVQRKQHPDAANRIWITFLDLREERVTLQREDKEKGTRSAKRMTLKPEHLISFVQNLMNRVCWEARSQILAEQRAQQDEILNGSTGIDFSQERLDDKGIDRAVGNAVEAFSTAVDLDFVKLNNLHSSLLSQMDYLDDTESLYLYADSQNEDEQWRIVRHADTLEQALPIMEDVIATLQEREITQQRENAQTVDFSQDAIVS